MFEFPKEMLRVFRDESTQKKFEENGYVILPFYSSDEVKELEELYYNLHPSQEKGFFPSTFSSDKNYRTVADEKIRSIGNRAIQKHLQDIKVMCGAFIVKQPGPESGMCVHQDMSLVDESKYTGINIWAPLVDLSVQNGTLFVLPKSHRIYPTYRSSTIPEFFADKSEEIIDYMIPVEIKAGEAVFFDQSIIHYSPPNYSDGIRIVTNTYFTHNNAEFRTYYHNNKMGKEVEGFVQNDSFMTDFDQFGSNIHDRPKVGNTLGAIPYNFPTLNSDYLAKHYTKTNAKSLIEAAAPVKEEQETEVVNSEAPELGIFSKIKKLFQ